MENWKKYLKEHDEGGDEDVDDFFDDLLFGEEEEPDAGTEGEEMNEELGVMTIAAGVALGGVIGVLAYKGASAVARSILSNLAPWLQQKIRDRDRQMDEENRQFILDAFQKDEELVKMLQRFDELTEIVATNKGERSEELRNQRAELKGLGSAITDKLRDTYQASEPDMPHKGRERLDYYGRNALRPRIKRINKQ